MPNYSITTPYGWVTGYPLNQTDPVNHPGQGFHNGLDYNYPMGTPVVVNGVTIGLSNNTGASTGPHLHVGKYVNGVVQDPGVGNGFQFTSAVVFDTGSDATNGNFVRITGDGALWNYLHLEKVLVTKGQVLKGVDMSDIPTSTQVGEEFQALAGRQPRQDELDLFVGLNWFDGLKQYLFPGVQTLRDTLSNLESERDKTLYPFVNAVCAELNIPITTDPKTVATAITALQKSGTPLNATNVNAYIKEHLS